MELSDDFHFSQSSLQDFVDCSKRFYLRHIRRIAWPAVEAEPFLEHERDMQAGSAFHRLVQQHLLGVPSQSLSDSAALQTHTPALQDWWDNYIRRSPLGSHPRTASLSWENLSPEMIFPEISLSIPLAGYRLAAKYDLIIKLENGCALIFDWKTSKHRPERRWLGSRLQTRVYPYVFVHAETCIQNSQPFTAGSIEMIYWFAAFPGSPEVFTYSQQACDEDEKYLLGLVAEIERRNENLFTASEDSRRCRFCAYRSLCDRGAAAGDSDESPSDVDLQGLSDEIAVPEFNFEQVGEIEF